MTHVHTHITHMDNSLEPYRHACTGAELTGNSRELMGECNLGILYSSSLLVQGAHRLPSLPLAREERAVAATMLSPDRVETSDQIEPDVFSRSSFLVWLTAPLFMDPEETSAQMAAHRLPDGVGTNGIVAEVPQFPLMNIHGEIWATNVKTCCKT